MVGRTQSAVSMQIKRLEETLGQKVLNRGKGGRCGADAARRVPAGPRRQILALNDEVVAMFRAPALAGTVRLGTPDDYAFGYLPPILKRFADTHPAVQVDVLCAPSNELIERLKAGELDLTLVLGRAPAAALADGAAVARAAGLGDVVTPRAASAGPAAAGAGAGRRQGDPQLRLGARGDDGAGPRRDGAIGWPIRRGPRSGTHAPVLAGLAVTVSTLSWLPDGLRPLRADEGLPPLPEFGILLLKGRRPRQPMTDALAAQIRRDSGWGQCGRWRRSEGVGLSGECAAHLVRQASSKIGSSVIRAGRSGATARANVPTAPQFRSILSACICGSNSLLTCVLRWPTPVGTVTPAPRQTMSSGAGSKTKKEIGTADARG